MNKQKRSFFSAKKWLGLTILILFSLGFVLAQYPQPEHIDYGVSFSKFHSDELKLDWRETYLAILDELGVKRVRLSAHWPNTQPKVEEFNFVELDFQMEEALNRGVEVILAIGRRLPGWPECHVPQWAQRVEGNVNYDKEALLRYLEVIVDRYKNYPNLKYWQVENEPFLTFFSRSQCGLLEANFLKEEISLVKKLDSLHPVLVTDSGEFGDWFRAYGQGDVFGTSLYLYIWNHRLGPLRYPITPAFFRIKRNLIELFRGSRPAILIELSAEPWLLQPIIDTPLDIQFSRLGVEKLGEMISFARQSSFDQQYFWGAEWWYWLKKQNQPEHWEIMRNLLSTN